MRPLQYEERLKMTRITHIIDITPGTPVLTHCGRKVADGWNQFRDAAGESGLHPVEACTPREAECGRCFEVWSKRYRQR